MLKSEVYFFNTETRCRRSGSGCHQCTATPLEFKMRNLKKKSHKVCVGSGIYTKPKVEPPPRQCSLVSLTFLSPLIKSVAALSNNININHSNIPVRGGWTEPGR